MRLNYLHFQANLANFNGSKNLSRDHCRGFKEERSEPSDTIYLEMIVTIKMVLQSQIQILVTICTVRVAASGSRKLGYFKELAEGGPGNRTVSEETLTELNVPSRKTSTPSDDTEKRKRLQTKRQRNSAVAVSPAFVHPPSPTSS